MITKTEFKDLTCSVCEKLIGFTKNPKHIPEVICARCAESAEEFWEARQEP